MKGACTRDFARPHLVDRQIHSEKHKFVPQYINTIIDA
jgi:hypothetical protein